MTLLKRLDLYIDDLKSRVGVDIAVGTVSAYHYTRKALAELIKKTVQYLRHRFRATQRAVHPGFSRLCAGRERLCDGDCAPLSGNIEENLQDGFQRGASGKVLFLPLQTPQAEIDRTQSIEP